MMKEGSGVWMSPRQPMVAVSPSPSAAYLSPAMGVPTPSPFSFSVASTRWSSSRPFVHYISLFLRVMTLVFSFGSSLALATTMSNNKQYNYKLEQGQEQEHEQEQSFQYYPEFVYSILITSLAFIYSAYQLFKGVSDIAFKAILISDKTSDYTSFIFDQLAGYLLVSCSSVIALTIHQLEKKASLQKAAIVSVCMSLVALLTIAVCAILSGYKLSKRIMW